MFSHVDKYSGDSILSLNEAFQKDPRPEKVNLTIGIYFDEEGKPPLMEAVRDAEEQLAKNLGPRSYLPMAGIPGYRRRIQDLLFGKNAAVVTAGRVATVQTLGGSGALRVAAEFIKTYFSDSRLWVSNPTWDNHRHIFGRAGVGIAEYPYYDAASGGLQFDAMMGALQQATRGDAILLHACCHNPTGVDLSNDQWRSVVELLRSRGLLPVVDIAYQGFGDGLEEDAFLVRELAAQNVPCIIANSFSKNFSLYGERCGGLSVLCEDTDETDRVSGQLTSIIRGIYSNPPTHGARIISTILETPTLTATWRSELDKMRLRIASMRDQLHRLLGEKLPDECFDRYINQRGMFTYTGLSAQQVDRLNVDYGVFLVRSGRMCMAALNEYNLEITASSIAQVMMQNG